MEHLVLLVRTTPHANGPHPKGNSVYSVSSPPRRSICRTAVVALASGLFVTAMVTGAPLAAAGEGAQDQGGVTATLAGLELSGAAIVRVNGEERHVQAGLFEMAVDNGGMLRTYGVDLDAATQRDARYQETPWAGTSLGTNAAAGKVRWILRNSYPQVNDLAELARRAGAPGLTEQDAATGTQIAIWRHSDGAGARSGTERTAREIPRITAVDPQAEKLADHLERKARSLPEPEASLLLDDSALSARTPPAARDDGRVGPVKVRSNARQAIVQPDARALAAGVRIVDAKGRPVTTVRDGGELYFAIPEGAAPGSAALTVQTSTTVPVGRALTSGSRSQTQVLAGSSVSTVSATATVNWAGAGPIPALSGERNCAEGGLDLTVGNAGDEVFAFELMGTRHRVAAGRTGTVTVPLKEDQSYDFTIRGPYGYEKRVDGILDCRTRSGDTEGPRPMSAPSPASAGVLGGDSGSTADLAATGSSRATFVIGGVAVALVVIGGAAMLVLRRKPSGRDE